MCHRADGSDRKTVSDNSVDFLAMTASLLSYVFVHGITIEIAVAVQFPFCKIFSLSPPAGRFLEVTKSCSQSLNTDHRDPTIDLL